MCLGGVEYVSHDDYYNPKRTAAPVRTSGDGDGGTVGNGYSTKPLNATGIGTDSWGKTGPSKSTMTTAPTRSTSRTTGLNIGGDYSGGLY